MPKTTFLPIFIIIINIFGFSNSAHCQEETGEKNYSFSFGTQFGLVHGQAFELVYPDGSTKGELLSELIWDMKPVFYLGLQFDFERANIMSAPGFFTSLSAKFGIPADSGIMEDRDWLSTENDALTNFSSHTNKTNEFVLMDIAVGASFPVKSFLYIKPFFSGSWMHFSFTGRDGYKKYARYKSKNPDTFYPIDDNPETETITGNVISYTQDWLLIATGFSIGTEILSPFSFELSFQISPFAYCAATDHHIYRDTVFKDFTSLGLFLEPKGKISFTVERIEFSLETAYRYIGRTRGASYENEGGTGFFVSSSGAGASLSLLDIHFLVRLRI
jgi:outer membrane protease